MSGPAPLTAEEKQAIAALQRLAKSWPKSLWLFSAAGTLNVMKTNEAGERARKMEHWGGQPAEGLDPDYIVASVAISNDGGDF